MNTQLSHAESEPQISSTKRWSLPSRYPSNPRKVMIVLAVCMALQITSFVMILPLFSRRLNEIGAGANALGASAMAFALAATLSAPFMGGLADRFGRRPLVLGSLAAYVLAFSGYLLASSALAFIVIRALAGAFTAGLIPAVTGIAADLAPTERRAQWIGWVSGGAAIGWIVGPILGGVLYDHWGYGVPFMVSIIMAVATFTTALLTVPETRQELRRPAAKAARSKKHFRPGGLISSVRTFKESLPGSLSSMIVLLCIYFTVMFAWAFIEPKFMFYAYDDMGWNASMLGLVMSTYGIAMMLGEFGLSHLSDRFGRKPVIIAGLALFSAQFIGLAFFRNYVLIAVTFILAGLGNALFDPALSASILDIAPADHQVRILGIKSTAGSLGNILGPALVILCMPYLTAQGIFLIASGVVVLFTLAGLAIRMRHQPSETALSSQMADGGANYSP
jgi:MFS transporter, DHA1 family, multidrug resistance protein